MKNVYDIPTGHIFVDDYSLGELETLSIGDYGKERNVKADFLGLTNEINSVPNGHIKPLSEKWVITLSTQFGCPMKCTFCDVPKVGYKGNASLLDLKNQFLNGIKLYPQVKYTERLNIHFARMGEPVFNSVNVFDFVEWLFISKHLLRDCYDLSIETIHPVFTTMCPDINNTGSAIKYWVTTIKNLIYNGQAGLQLSINSTDEKQRNEMFQNKQKGLKEISEICDSLPKPIGRKYCLNFALADEYETDGQELAKMFDPDKFMVKITPIHNNSACQENGIVTSDGYHSYTPYKEAEQSFRDAGFDVLVFVPSMDEEKGLITCGNAVLSGEEPTNTL